MLLDPYAKFIVPHVVVKVSFKKVVVVYPTLQRNEVINWVFSTSIVVDTCSKVEKIFNWFFATGFISWWDGCLHAEDLPLPAPILG